MDETKEEIEQAPQYEDDNKEWLNARKNLIIAGAILITILVAAIILFKL